MNISLVNRRDLNIRINESYKDCIELYESNKPIFAYKSRSYLETMVNDILAKASFEPTDIGARLAHLEKIRRKFPNFTEPFLGDPRILEEFKRLHTLSEKYKGDEVVKNDALAEQYAADAIAIRSAMAYLYDWYVSLNDYDFMQKEFADLSRAVLLKEKAELEAQLNGTDVDSDAKVDAEPETTQASSYGLGNLLKGIFKLFS